MDISKLNGREKAEKGIFVPICEAYSMKPYGKGDDAPGFMVRGMASRSAQSRLAEMQRAAKETTNGEATEDEQQAAMEQFHSNLIDAAMKYIIRAVNLEADGKPVDDDEAMIRRILEDIDFPDMKPVKDDAGQAVMHSVKVPMKDDDGNVIKDDKGKPQSEWVEVPKMELVNKTVAQQIIEAAEDGSRFFGKTASG